MQRIVFGLLLLTLFLASCSGPAGPAGPTGATGPAGPTGPSGPPGNAGVIATDWTQIPASRWQNIAGAGSTQYTDTGDLSVMAVNSWYNLTNDQVLKAAILVYVDPGNGACLLPCERNVSGGGSSGVVRLKSFFDTNVSFAKWLDPVATLRSGTWDRDSYIKNTYLPGLRWRVVIIPAPAAASAASSLDHHDYAAVMHYYGLEE